MQFALVNSVPYEGIENHVAAELRGPLPPQTSAHYTLLVFRSGRVVHGGPAAKATRRLPMDSGLPALAIGTTFTEEAQEVLRRAGVFLVERKPYYWTDKSHEDIKVLVGSKVKGPDHR